MMVSLTLFFCVAAQSDCNSKNKPQTNKPNIKNQNMNANLKPDEPITKPGSGGEIKILAEDSYSKIETPFIFVARTNETYTQMQSLVEKLPPASEINFDKFAVVGAFAGTKNTGGYSVAIKQTAGKISLEVVPPSKDAMTTQALTMPFQVALIPIEKENALSLDIPAEWQNAAQNYKVVSSKFEFSGGITGRSENFSAAGTIKLLSFGENVTLIFDLSGGAKNARRLTETASGKINDGKIGIAWLDAGSFSENPKPPLKISGTLAGKNLNLDFEPLPSNIADGFQVRGKIEAVKQ